MVTTWQIHSSNRCTEQGTGSHLIACRIGLRNPAARNLQILLLLNRCPTKLCFGNNASALHLPDDQRSIRQ